MVDLRIEQAQQQHASALDMLEREHWDDGTRPAPPPPSPFLERNPIAHTWVAVDGHQRVLGYVVLGNRTPFASNAHVLCLRSLVVAQTARRRGIGRQLLDRAIAEARRRGVRKLSLTVLGSNRRAIELYRQQGFREEGRLVDEFCFGSEYVDDLFMALHFT
ncbi:GNAT family N-acetyltransferase [Porticoccus sp.]